MSITCVRRLQFCAGHRVYNHGSKCRHIHGHNYVALFHAEAEELNELGMVIDFSVLKEKIGGWIDEHWDHGFIAYEGDTKVKIALEAMQDDSRVFLLPDNPTAENLAHYLLRKVCPKVLSGCGVTVTKVVLWETENCYAEARRA